VYPPAYPGTLSKLGVPPVSPLRHAHKRGKFYLVPSVLEVGQAALAALP
jgi:hypothetical protein